MRKPTVFAYAKTKTRISFAVTANLMSAFVFSTWIVQYLYFLNPKFQASTHLQWLYSLVCVRPGQNPHFCFSNVAAHINDATFTKRNLQFHQANKQTSTMNKLSTAKPALPHPTEVFAGGGFLYPWTTLTSLPRVAL